METLTTLAAATSFQDIALFLLWVFGVPFAIALGLAAVLFTIILVAD